MNSKFSIIATLLASVFAHSLCCVVPLLAMLAGISGMAASFDWLTHMQPYLLMANFAFLGVAFYKVYGQPSKEHDCTCDEDHQKKNQRNKQVLWVAAIFSLVMLVVTLVHFSIHQH
ncbi:mercuric transporter MerT family protein [Rapidithrix thailandica]|uniref:Mercuric transport protein MerT n=1 Tax=Rapidithrix thailandica TaxID=413964 RepID=A0AAW9S0M1_9BACT